MLDFRHIQNYVVFCRGEGLSEDMTRKKVTGFFGGKYELISEIIISRVFIKKEFLNEKLSV